ncbi:MAG: pitrilysin family protein [Bacillota bacterium]|nr:pitrilysin family protein [Bacillota bacterium]
MMYKTNTLSNGLKIAYENIPYARSVSAGVWVLSGSRYEKISGMSHFIEHMFFKGTKTKTAKEIAQSMDSTGGQLNAFTTREYTCFYAHTVADKLAASFEILSDMLLNSKLSSEDIELEKRVVIEEIAMYEDSPEDLTFDLLLNNAWKDQPLGRNIAGTKESVASFTREDILEHINGFYVPEKMLISVAGLINEDEVLSLSNQYFGKMEKRVPLITENKKPIFNAGSHRAKKDIEQANIAFGFESFDMQSEKKYPLAVMNYMFGGGMSSRLFQSIREKEGLAYSIYSSVESYKDAGMFSIYAGLNRENLEKTRDLIKKEIDLLLKEGISDEELYRSKEQIKGSIILGHESVGSKMNTIGKGLILLGKVQSEEEIISKIDEVNLKDVQNVIEEIFASGRFFEEIVTGQ